MESENVRVDEFSKKNEQNNKNEPEEYQGFVYPTLDELAAKNPNVATNEETCEV